MNQVQGHEYLILAIIKLPDDVVIPDFLVEVFPHFYITVGRKGGNFSTKIPIINSITESREFPGSADSRVSGGFFSGEIYDLVGKFCIR